MRCQTELLGTRGQRPCVNALGSRVRENLDLRWTHACTGRSVLGGRFAGWYLVAVSVPDFWGSNPSGVGLWWRVSSIGLCGCRGHPPNSGWNNSTAATTQRARNPGVVAQPEKFLCDIPSKMIGSRGQIDKKISHSTGPLSPGPGAGSPPERFHKFFFFFFIGRRGEE